MDGVGRFSRSLIARLAGAGADAFDRAGDALRRHNERRAPEPDDGLYHRPGGFALALRRVSIRIVNLNIPRRAGLFATLALFAATGVYGVQRGGHAPDVTAFLLGIGDTAANAAGLQVKSVRLTGNRQMTHDQVLDAAGIGPTTSVLFFDPDQARERLKANPWIADATIQKLYPDQLLISVTEREPFALWQREGKIVVIAADGRMVLDHVDTRFDRLPLIVGKGAETRAREIVDLLAAQPRVAEAVRASVLVAERRWTLVLKNGIDVRLPDENTDRALAELARLDTEKRLMSRDLTMIDLRVPDRVTVRLSEDAMKAHEAALRERERARRRAQGQRT